MRCEPNGQHSNTQYTRQKMLRFEKVPRFATQQTCVSSSRKNYYNSSGKRCSTPPGNTPAHTTHQPAPHTTHNTHLTIHAISQAESADGGGTANLWLDSPEESLEFFGRKVFQSPDKPPARTTHFSTHQPTPTHTTHQYKPHPTIPITTNITHTAAHDNTPHRKRVDARDTANLFPKSPEESPAQNTHNTHTNTHDIHHHRPQHTAPNTTPQRRSAEARDTTNLCSELSEEYIDFFVEKGVPGPENTHITHIRAPPHISHHTPVHSKPQQERAEARDTANLCFEFPEESVKFFGRSCSRPRDNTRQPTSHK